MNRLKRIAAVLAALTVVLSAGAQALPKGIAGISDTVMVVNAEDGEPDESETEEGEEPTEPETEEPTKPVTKDDEDSTEPETEEEEVLEYVVNEEKTFSIQYVKAEDHVEIVGFASEGVSEGFDLVIPSAIDELPVTVIRDYAFAYGYWDIISVSIPEGVTSIGENAFLSCWGLSYVILPTSLTDIGKESFNNCESLMDVYYRGTEKAWNELGVADYYLLKTDMHFEYSGTGEELEHRYPEEEPDTSLKYPINESYFLKYEINNDFVWIVGFESYDTSLGLDLVIPSEIDGLTVKVIADNAFANNYYNLVSVTIPDGVELIGNEAFLSCWGMESVVIPASVMFISGNAFNNCENLKTVYYKGTEEQWNALLVGDDYLLNAEIIYDYVSEEETTEPEEDPTEPETDPTEPETDPTEPETEPTEPETEPTEPETEPVETATTYEEATTMTTDATTVAATDVVDPTEPEETAPNTDVTSDAAQYETTSATEAATAVIDPTEPEEEPSEPVETATTYEESTTMTTYATTAVTADAVDPTEPEEETGVSTDTQYETTIVTSDDIAYETTVATEAVTDVVDPTEPMETDVPEEPVVPEETVMTTAAAPAETTTVTEAATEPAGDEELPQTGRNSAKNLLGFAGAVSLSTLGFWAVTKSGILRKKNDEE